jgi:hypothetical protein
MRDATRKSSEFREWEPVWRQVSYWSSEVRWEDSTRVMKERKRNEQSIQEHEVRFRQENCSEGGGGGELSLLRMIPICGSCENTTWILCHRNGPAKEILGRRWRCELISDQDKEDPYFLHAIATRSDGFPPHGFSALRRDIVNAVIIVMTVKNSGVGSFLYKPSCY